MNICLMVDSWPGPFPFGGFAQNPRAGLVVGRLTAREGAKDLRRTHPA